MYIIIIFLFHMSFVVLFAWSNITLNKTKFCQNLANILSKCFLIFSNAWCFVVDVSLGYISDLVIYFQHYNGLLFDFCR